MGSLIVTILYYVILFAVIIGAYMLLKKYVFSKIRINKFIPLAIGIILFLIQLITKPTNVIVAVLLTVFCLLSLLWAWDIYQTGGPKLKNEKKIVMKPKAKPNRIKNQKNNK